MYWNKIIPELSVTNLESSLKRIIKNNVYISTPCPPSRDKIRLQTNITGGCFYEKTVFINYACDSAVKRMC